MLRQIQSLLAAPRVANKEQAHTAGILNTILISVLLLMVAASAAVFIFPHPWERRMPVFAVAAFSLGALVLLRRGYARLASWTLVFGLWMVNTLLTCFYDGMRSSVQSGYLLITIMAGLLLGGRAAVLLAAVTILASWIMFSTGIYKVFQERAVPLGASANWVLLSVHVSMAAALLSLALYRINRTRQELERQMQERTAQLYASFRVSHAAATILNPQSLMRQVVDLIQQHFDFYYVGLFLCEGDDAVLYAGTGDAGAQMLAVGHRLTIGGNSMIGQSVWDGQPRIALDVGAEAIRFDNPFLPETRSEMALPLRVRGHCIGAFTVQSRQQAAFSEQDIAALQTMADQVAIAIENARLYEAEQERRRIAETLQRAATMLNSTLDQEYVLELLLDQLRQVIPYDTAAVQRLEEDSLHIVACQGFEVPEQVLGLRFPLDPKFPNYLVVTEKRPLAIDDVVSRYPHFQQEAPVYTSGHIHAWLGVPLIVQDRLIGMISVDRATDRPYSADEIELATTFANHAAMTMENARLYERIQRQASELEERVTERTTELAAANRELESFAYSVSHDLRAPLRSVSGFTGALLDEYGALLDQPAQDYMLRIQRAGRRMEQLIDGLLTLSRVTRSTLSSSRVRLDSMARAVAAELREAQPERQVSFVIEDHVFAYGDPSLLRVVLQNLIGNAWKFTSRHTEGRIEFATATQPDGTRVYLVRDDGAGFDPAYADKMFGAFQRLHATAEFEGDGIGLATVKRIIERHGGRVWAEGKVERGATVYFTLGGRDQLADE